MEINANKPMTSQYVRNVITSFAKSGRDVMKDMLPETIATGSAIGKNINKIKNTDCVFTKLKYNLTLPHYNDDNSYDNTDERINTEFYQFSKNITRTVNKNVKYFSKTNKNLSATKIGSIPSAAVSSIKRILINSNNSLIANLDTITNISKSIFDFQDSIKLNTYNEFNSNLHDIFELVADMNNNFANYSRSRIAIRRNDITENRMHSLIKTENMFSIEEMDDVIRRILKNRFGVEEDDTTEILRIAKQRPMLGLFKLIMTINVDKRQNNIIDNFISIPKNYNNYIAFALNKFKENDNPIVRFLGEKFAPEKRKASIIYRDNYNKGNIKFDSYSRRAITHVIPTLLSKILNKLENRNNSEELVYDYKNGGFTTTGDIDKLKNKDKKAINSRITNLKSANKKRKALKNDFNYRERFSYKSEVAYKKENYKQIGEEYKIDTTKKPSTLTRLMTLIDDISLDINEPDRKLQKVIEKTIGIVANCFNEDGSPSMEGIRDSIITPLKKKFGDYLQSVKDYVKTTFGIAVNSVINEFKPKNEKNESLSGMIKKFATEKILIPMTIKVNNAKAKILLDVKDRVNIVANVLKKKMQGRLSRVSSYIPTIENKTKESKEIQMDLSNDTYSFNLIKYTMLHINKELTQPENIFNNISTNIYDIMRHINKVNKKLEKPGELTDGFLELRTKSTFKWIESLSKYANLSVMFIKDVIKVAEPMTMAYKVFKTGERIAINVLGTVTGAFSEVLNDATKLVKDIIKIFTDDIPAVLKMVDKFTSTVKDLMKSKLGYLPIMMVGVIAGGGTFAINKINSLLIDGTKSIIKFTGDAVRGLLTTVRLLGNAANKATMYGKHYLKKILTIGGRIFKNTTSNGNPLISKLEFATIKSGYLDEVRRIIKVEYVKKDTRLEDELIDDEKDRQKVLNTANSVVGGMEGRIEERTEALEDMVQKFLTKPLGLVKNLFSNVIGFIMGGTTGTLLGNAATKVYGWASNSKIGKFLGLDKTNKVFAKKVYIDGGSVDVNGGGDGIMDDIIEGGVDAASNKGFFKKIGSFLSKHKKGAIITGILAAAGGIFAWNKKKKKDEEETEDKPTQSKAEPVKEQSKAKPVDNEAAAMEKRNEMSKVKKVSTATPVNNSSKPKIEDTLATEEEILKSAGMTEKPKNAKTIESPNIIKADTMMATVESPINNIEFSNISMTDNEMKDMYNSNAKIEAQNESKLYGKLNTRDREELLAQEGIQGIYRKTADPLEKNKISDDRRDYKGMIKDFNKGFKFGGMIFGVLNMLVKSTPLTKFSNLIKDKQNYMDSNAKIRKAVALLGQGVKGLFGGVIGGAAGAMDGSTPGSGGGELINWPTGNMKLGEKMIMYGKLFLPSGTLKYSQSQDKKTGRYGIDNQGASADCSSFVRHIYRVTTGIDPGANSREQANAGTKITDASQLKPGDILWRSGHVAMYAGNNEYLNVGGNPDPDWRTFNPKTWSSFTCGRRVINPDQMVDSSLNNPNTAVTGLSGSKLSGGGSSQSGPTTASKEEELSDGRLRNADISGDPPEQPTKSKAVPVTNSINTAVTNNTNNDIGSKIIETNNEDEKIKLETPEVKPTVNNVVQDLSLEKLVSQKRQDNTLYGRSRTIHKLQEEIVNLLSTIDLDIESLLDLEDHLIVHIMKQVEGL